MLIFSVSFQFYRVQPRRVHLPLARKDGGEHTFALCWGDLNAELLYMVTVNQMR